MFGRSDLNDMWNSILMVFLFSIFCILSIGWFVSVVFFYKSLGCDYKTTVVVDDSLKVEWAISNAVDDVKSRNFVVTKLDVRTWHDKKFKVTCGGVDKANLLKR